MVVATNNIDESAVSRSINAGDWVRIRSADSIVSTLDETGCLSGLPFMPEMVPYCGSKFRIGRLANSVCVNNNIRELDGCVVLQMEDRCSGAAHGGCQFACHFIWRLDWLEPIDERDSDSRLNVEPTTDIQHNSKRLVQLTTACISRNTEPGRVVYRCQGTELANTTRGISVFQLRQYREQYLKNKVSLARIFSFLFYAFSKKLLRKSDSLIGPCMGRTPVVKLDLQVGDHVRVKSLQQIRETLDQDGCNRGLWFDKDEMAKYCGLQMVVSRRVERIIDETTGSLFDLKVPSVILSEAACSGRFRRFCSRGMLFMWREGWVERL